MKSKAFNYFLSGILCLFWGMAVSQQYHIKSFSTQNGLANSTVNQIFLDSRGYLWFATQGGLSRFDGKKYKSYTSKEGLPGNNITSVCEDSEGDIWVAAFGAGLSRFNGNSFQVFDQKSGLANLSINSIYKDSKDNIWIATAGGVFSYDGKHMQSYTTANGLPCDDFFCVTEDKNHRMWFGSHSKGLVCMDGKKIRVFNRSDGLTDDNVFCLTNDSKGNLWIGTTSGGVCFFDGTSISQVKIPGLEKAFVNAIRQDQRSNMWFATDIGLCKMDGMGHTTLFTEKNGLSSNNLYALCEDYEGNIWVGSNQGACLFSNETFVTYTDKEGLTNQKITSVLQTSSGSLLIGTDGSGISIRKGERIEQLKIKELENGKVISLFEDSQRRVWVGLEAGGNNLLVLRGKNDSYELEKAYTNLAKSQIKTVSKVLEDKTGNIWIATYGSGAFRINGDIVTQYKDSSNVKTQNLFTMFLDKKGNVWFGTFDQGVIKYDPHLESTGHAFTNYTKKNGLGDNWIWSICEDKNGMLYFGTNENGVTRYDGTSFANISTKQGLPSDLVYALVTDDKNRLWVGTDKGVSRISTDKEFNVLGYKYYGEQEGLRSTEVQQGGFMFGKDGKLWICTTNGLTRYDPKFDYVNSTPPRVVLNGIRLFYQDVDWKKYTNNIDPVSKLPSELSLTYKDNHLTFDYQALTNGNVRYMFKLDGLDAGWSPLTTNTQAVYTNIPPGDNYSFQVKAVNSDGFWSADTVSFSFRITPPFWKTWWFFTLCTIVVMGSVIIFIRRRTAKLEEEKRFLEERVEERTVELKGANDQLSVAFKDIKDSINYAQRIQQAILPLSAEIRKELPDHFIYFKPRDVVSGDFYWFNKKNDKVFIAACDCTGHGVPGAFMSIIGNSLLNEISHESTVSDPAEILNLLRDKIILALKQRSGEQETKDGMDMILCCIDKQNKKLSFAGANNPLYIIRNGELIEFKGNKQPIGVYGDELKPFTSQEFDLQKGDQIYLFSDGYPDQFGGPRGKKFLYTRFKELLLAVSPRSMEQQYTDLDRAFWDWKKDNDQVDDVLVIGIRV
jgi:ligand-binding sensor domain-containing protein/serine phosphatase RsbU (regulator of sigma subunit)